MRPSAKQSDLTSRFGPKKANAPAVRDPKSKKSGSPTKFIERSKDNQDYNELQKVYRQRMIKARSPKAKKEAF